MIDINMIVNAFEISRNNMNGNLSEYVFFDTFSEKIIYIVNPQNLEEMANYELLDKYIKQDRYIQLISALSEDYLVMMFIEDINDKDVKTELHHSFVGPKRQQKFKASLEECGYVKRFYDFVIEEKYKEAQKFCELQSIEYYG